MLLKCCPVRPTTLVRTVGSAEMSSSHEGLAVAEAGSDGPPIVVVEDDDSLRQLIVQCLGKSRLRNPIRVAVDGRDAMEVLAGLEAVPALVLLDVGLPGLSGLDVFAWIREQPRLAAVPVMMLTGSSELADVDRAYDLGISRTSSSRSRSRPSRTCCGVWRCRSPVRSAVRSAVTDVMGTSLCKSNYFSY